MTYPLTEPLDSGLLDVGDGHQLFWEVCGHPQGKPAVVLHGGPGSGTSPWWRQFFDPERYRVVLIDQRGCGRSTPHAGDDLAALDHNTTQDLVADLEKVREHLGVERWLVFGGSWGSTLGLAYALEHAERVSELVLWAVVTTRKRDIDWLTHTLGDVYPQEYDALLSVLPEGDRAGNIPLAFTRLLSDPDPAVADRAARAWCAWEDRIATLAGPVVPNARYADPRFRLGFVRLVCHYFGHYAFLDDDALIGRLAELREVPTYLLRGRLDLASPLRSALEVSGGLPRAEFRIVEADAHGAGDDTVECLVKVLDTCAAGRFAPGSVASDGAPVPLDSDFVDFLTARLLEEKAAAAVRADSTGNSPGTNTTAGDSQAGLRLLDEITNGLLAGNQPDPMSLRLLVLAYDRHPEFRREWSPWSG